MLSSKRPSRCMRLAAAVVMLAFASEARAFKWSSCPAPPLPIYPPDIGATNTPFIHPGHELTIVLNRAQVAATGGFGLSPDANTVSILFPSIFGPPVHLDARSATATSRSSLTFAFPDSEAEIGRTAA